jgi:hypothetical protein
MKAETPPRSLADAPHVPQHQLSPNTVPAELRPTDELWRQPIHDLQDLQDQQKRNIRHVGWLLKRATPFATEMPSR